MNSRRVGDLAAVFGLVHDGREALGAKHLAALVVAVVGAPAQREGDDGPWDKSLDGIRLEIA